MADLYGQKPGGGSMITSKGVGNPTNTVRRIPGKDKKTGVKIPGKGRINPIIGKDIQAAGLSPAQPFINLAKASANMNKNPAGRTLGLPLRTVRTGGAFIRHAQEGNIGMPLGGMPPPPAGNGVSPDMAKEAESLGIEVAPPGATAEEVADDQLVLLSEGELVVPANVVRYHGLAQYEKMRKTALEGLTEMDQQGQLVSTQENPMPEGLVGPAGPAEPVESAGPEAPPMGRSIV